ncbi:hypothetical protein HPB49_007584 [Dermacentor silvarum]|uniref:Uncharacterized protein n=1 Tax=Dermacentor silvarum TaxID=543639 RepID=A0ACB8C2I5_DERSI|nr:hypothetical protein HPB49_007584 [Dermacentor silvarum]
MDTLLTLPSKVEGLESSVRLLSDKFDEFHTRLITQEKLTKELTKRVEELENESPSRDLTQIKQEIDNLEYRSRRLNLEIHGIPASENEDLMAKMNEIAMKLKVPTVTRNDITHVHRLRAKVGKTPARCPWLSSGKPPLSTSWTDAPLQVWSPWSCACAWILTWPQRQLAVENA